MSSQNPLSQEIHLPTRFELFDRNAWIEGLLTKIETGKHRPETPVPSRSPSPRVQQEDDDVVYSSTFLPVSSADGGDQQDSIDELIRQEEEGRAPVDVIPKDVIYEEGQQNSLAHNGIVASYILEQAIQNTEAYLEGTVSCDLISWCTS